MRIIRILSWGSVGPPTEVVRYTLQDDGTVTGSGHRSVLASMETEGLRDFAGRHPYRFVFPKDGHRFFDNLEFLHSHAFFAQEMDVINAFYIREDKEAWFTPLEIRC